METWQTRPGQERLIAKLTKPHGVKIMASRVYTQMRCFIRKTERQRGERERQQEYNMYCYHVQHLEVYVQKRYVRFKRCNRGCVLYVGMVVKQKTTTRGQHRVKGCPTPSKNHMTFEDIKSKATFNPFSQYINTAVNCQNNCNHTTESIEDLLFNLYLLLH